MNYLYNDVIFVIVDKSSTYCNDINSELRVRLTLGHVYLFLNNNIFKKQVLHYFVVYGHIITMS